MAGRDIVFIAAILFTVGLLLFIVNYVTTTAVDSIITSPVINATPQSAHAFTATRNLTNKFDYLVFAFFIGLILATIVLSWFVPANIIFVSFYFIATIMATIVAAVLSNVWGTATTSSVFGATTTHFPITNFLMAYLPYEVAVIGIIGIVIMFAKPVE